MFTPSLDCKDIGIRKFEFESVYVQKMKRLCLLKQEPCVVSTTVCLDTPCIKKGKLSNKQMPKEVGNRHSSCSNISLDQG